MFERSSLFLRELAAWFRRTRLQSTACNWQQEVQHQSPGFYFLQQTDQKRETLENYNVFYLPRSSKFCYSQNLSLI